MDEGLPGFLQAAQDLPCHCTASHKAGHGRNTLSLFGYLPYYHEFCACLREGWGVEASILHQLDAEECIDSVPKGGKGCL